MWRVTHASHSVAAACLAEFIRPDTSVAHS
jgi:hypothetical protein